MFFTESLVFAFRFQSGGGGLVTANRNGRSLIMDAGYPLDFVRPKNEFKNLPLSVPIDYETVRRWSPLNMPMNSSWMIVSEFALRTRLCTLYIFVGLKSN